MEQGARVRIAAAGGDARALRHGNEFRIVGVGDQRHHSHFSSELPAIERHANGDGIEKLLPVLLVRVAPTLVGVGFAARHLIERQLGNRGQKIESAVRA
jgi:hypothetical protein